MHFTASSEPKKIAEEDDEAEKQKMEPKVFDDVSWLKQLFYSVKIFSPQWYFTLICRRSFWSGLSALGTDFSKEK